MEWVQDRQGVWGLWDNASLSGSCIRTLPLGEWPPDDGLPQYPNSGPQSAIDAVVASEGGSVSGSDAGAAGVGLGARLPSLDAMINHKWVWVALIATGLLLVVASHRRGQR